MGVSVIGWTFVPVAVSFAVMVLVTPVLLVRTRLAALECRWCGRAGGNRRGYRVGRDAKRLKAGAQLRFSDLLTVELDTRKAG